MKFLTTAFLIVLLTSPVNAEMSDSIDEMCQKIKTCGLAEIQKQGLPEGMEQMMIGMFDGMCASWMQPYAKTIGQAGLEKKAEACIDSMIDTSCDELMAQEGEFTSGECKEFEKAADKAGVDLGKK